MQASTWICTYQMQSSSWACSPYLCASLVQEIWSFSILQCCSLFVHVQLLLLPMMHFISLFQLLPFVINFHKRCASYWYKGLHWVRWLTLQSNIFYGQHNIYWNDTSCRIFDLDTNWWGTSPCHSMCHCWYFLTSTEVNPQAYGITVVAFTWKYSGYRIFHREWRYFF